MSIYPKPKDPKLVGKGLLQPDRLACTVLNVPSPHATNIIMIHGVNDLGVSFGEVEAGLCSGLNTRLKRQDLIPAQYSVPETKDKNKLEDDPDAVFFKRKANSESHTPVIPFYWGFREVTKDAKDKNGQKVDRYNNRLDKDLSKGGGPFANATTNLVDFWNRGAPNLLGGMDKIKADPLRPVLGAPGRMYMVLAAKRLAALVTMIRDYDANDTVTIVAHSQGCLISLLAQAFLLEGKNRPADTLILTHPPYSLEEPLIEALGNWGADSWFTAVGGGEDACMKPHYRAIEGMQLMRARLDTLINIVKGVQDQKNSTPSLSDFKTQQCGVVGASWEPDRDNRGKVYLYFCPEDMTVALQNVRGIGWQGVPESITGHKLEQTSTVGGYKGMPIRKIYATYEERREALKELGPGFFQRVFTRKKRPDPQTGKLTLVGQAPHDFVLKMHGEDDRAHAEDTGWTNTHLPTGKNNVVQMARPDPSGHPRYPGSAQELPPNEVKQMQAQYRREQLAAGVKAEHLGEIFRAVRWPDGRVMASVQQPNLHDEDGRKGIRRITGEALVNPVEADTYAGAIPGTAKPGTIETVDPIDAAIASTSDNSYSLTFWEIMDDPTDDRMLSRVGNLFAHEGPPSVSPCPKLYSGKVVQSPHKESDAVKRWNMGKAAGDAITVKAVYTCLEGSISPQPNGQLLILRFETPNEVRLRMQTKGTSPRSFHGAIFGSRKNHEQVTAYDVAIGGGKASSDPEFHAYLCAVADWRLKKPEKEKEKIKPRPNILRWAKFVERFGKYLSVEKAQRVGRAQLIEANADYYSSGVLPNFLPLLPNNLPPALVSETTQGCRIEHAQQQHADASDVSTGEAVA